jgi:hypothetical protein
MVMLYMMDVVVPSGLFRVLFLVFNYKNQKVTPSYDGGTLIAFVVDSSIVTQERYQY